MVKHSSIPPPRRIICIDLDETLALTLDALIQFHNSTYGTKLTREDFTSYKYHEVWGGTEEEAYLKVREFYRSPHFLNIQPMQDGALETLKILKKRKFTLAIVTSRQQFVAEQTKRFVDRHFPGIFESIYFCNQYLTAAEKLQYISKSKSAICREIGAEMLIDDSLEHTQECATMGIDVLLFDLRGLYRWNQPPSGISDQTFLTKNIKRVTTWKAVQTYFPSPRSPLRYSYTPTADDFFDFDDNVESEDASSESEGSVGEGVAVMGAIRPEYVQMNAVMA